MKKRICLALAVVTALSVCMTSCTNNNAKNTDGDMPELLWYMNADPQNDLPKVLEKVNEVTTKELGVKLKIKLIDDGAYTERLRMYMASGEKFDLCFTGYVNPYISAVKNGGLTELTELLDTTSLRDIVPDYAFQALNVDGKIYAVPNSQGMATAPAYFLRKEVAEKYGLDKIDSVNSLDELEPYFEKMKKDFPDMYPVTTSASDDISSGYLYINDYCMIKNDDPNHKILFAQEQPVYKKGLERAKQWYKKGYVRSDVETVGDLSAEIKAGKYCGTFTSIVPGALANYKNEYGIDAHAIQYAPTYMSVSQMSAASTGISATSENPEKAIKLIELANTDKEFLNLIQFGIEGVHYEKIDDNHVKSIAREQYYMFPWKFGNAFNSYLFEGEDNDRMEKTKQQNDESQKASYLGFNVNTDEIKNELAQCNAVKEEYYDTLRYGASDYEELLPTYIKRLKQAGVERLISVIQSQLDEWWEKNK